MPYTFVPVGKFWINLELVTSVELIDGPKQPDITIAVRIHYATGKHQDLHGQVEVKDLVDFLTTHRAT